MSVSTDPLSFNDAIGLHILSFLDPNDLGRCAQVSKGWKRLSDDNVLWKQTWDKISNMPRPAGEECLKGTIIKLCAVSFEQIIAKVMKFAKTVPLHEIRHFSVFFPLMNETQISVHVGRGDVQPDQQASSGGYCVLVKDLKMHPSYLIHFEKDISDKISQLFNGKRGAESKFFVKTRCDLPGMTVGPRIQGTYHLQPVHPSNMRKII